MQLMYLNLGCGSRFHEQWNNIDFKSNPPDVVGHNLLKGIPFENQTFEVVYHSHLLEHLKKKQAEDFESFKRVMLGVSSKVNQWSR